MARKRKKERNDNPHDDDSVLFAVETMSAAECPVK
jgi:hypothetical protein